VVRYGNVMGSRGSVIPFFLSKAKEGMLPITHPEMTRFNILLREGVDMVLWSLEHALGGEIFVAKVPSYRLMDLAEAIGPSCRHEVVGIRGGEKIHEELITESDSFTTVDLGDYYAILPAGDHEMAAEHERQFGASKVAMGFSYHSGRNPDMLNVEQLRALIRTELDPAFTPV
jgi:UDP-N-acetylglucosamine 4,6-dehydratase/5-epimerase